ncbi:MAG: glycosyltransferase family 2 protein [Chloroflexi bacterium]|nr:glycosyltransferase family 2 protein [Chloroflexota bacterium]MCY4245965.1 glycosyltransferase family 2 protein [Chloroflexota bacterium]
MSSADPSGVVDESPPRPCAAEEPRARLDLSIIIVSYNTRELLRNCLRSLRDSQGLVLEIIVVDNASSDGSADMVRADFPHVRLRAQTVNSWFCGGNNIGSAVARSDYVLLLNPDTEVSPDALPQMLRFLRENAGYSGVTAQLVYPNGAIQQTCARIPRFENLLLDYTLLGWLLPRRKKRRHAELVYADWDRASDRDVEAIPGSCTLLRRADAQLDADLLLYFPEEDLARRLGGQMRYLAAARIVHHEKSSTRNWLATRIFFRDMLVYARKHHRLLRMLLLWLLSRPLYWAMWLKNR